MTTFEQALERAREMGREHGKARGSWVFDGASTEDDYRRVLVGLADGDPEILDSLPGTPLSGEWADDLTPTKLAEDVGFSDWDKNPDDLDSLCDAYEDAWYEAMLAEVERTARYHLQG